MEAFHEVQAANFLGYRRISPASHKFDRIEILDFSRSGLKHPGHRYVGDLAPGMAKIVLPVAARTRFRKLSASSAASDANATLEAGLPIAR